MAPSSQNESARFSKSYRAIAAWRTPANLWQICGGCHRLKEDIHEQTRHRQRPTLRVRNRPADPVRRDMSAKGQQENSCIAAKGYSITASGPAGNPASRRSAVMRSLRPNVGQMQPPISRPTYMNDDDHRTSVGNKHAEQPFVRSVLTRHQDPKWSGVQDPMHGFPKRLVPTFAPHRAARRRIPIPR